MSPSPLLRRTASLVDYLIVGKALSRYEREQIVAFGSDPDPEALALSLASTSPLSWTLARRDTDEPLAVGGFVIVGPEVYRTWFLYNDRVFAEHGADATRLIAETAKQLAEAQGSVRIETWCLADAPAHVTRWYEALGMYREATLRGYGAHGETVALYAWLSAERDTQAAAREATSTPATDDDRVPAQ